MYERSDASLLSERFHAMIQERKRLQSLEDDGSAALPSAPDSFGSSMGYYMQRKKQMQKKMSEERTSTTANSLKYMPKKAKSKGRLSREDELAHKKQSKQEFKLLYSQEFEKTILDFQLQEHERFLYEFNQLFKGVDTDNNGVVNEQEFR